MILNGAENLKDCAGLIATIFNDEWNNYETLNIWNDTIKKYGDFGLYDSDIVKQYDICCSC